MILGSRRSIVLKSGQKSRVCDAQSREWEPIQNRYKSDRFQSAVLSKFEATGCRFIATLCAGYVGPP